MFDDTSSVLGLDRLSNDELLTCTRRLVGCDNQLLAALLAHLGEVEARGIHRERSCASLYTYCVYELRMSEDSALRRAKAARVVRRFPASLGAIARGELHLTGLLLLGPHLTEANLVEVLALAKHRTKKEIEKLVRRLDPLPDVPPRIEPLGPASSGLPRAIAPTWAAMTAGLAGPVRELLPGERPSDWVSEPAQNASTSAFELETPAPSQDESPSLRVPERYSVQFTATQEYVDLLQEARDLLSHAAPNAALDEVHRRALECLARELRKKKYAETTRFVTTLGSPRRGIPEGGDQPREPKPEPEPKPSEGRRSSRHIPAAVRRRVAERDERRCTYVAACGQRCRETRLLEFHHLEAHAHGGPPTEANITLRCASHNTLAAEEDFGREHMREKQGHSDPRQRGESDPRAETVERTPGRVPKHRSSTRASAAKVSQTTASDAEALGPDS
jgi:hypothetical protein